MFDFVRRHTRVLFFILLLLIIPGFGLLGNGMDSVRSAVGQQTVATVDGRAITQAELERASQRKLDQIRRESPDIDIQDLDTPALRQASLDELVRDRVLEVAVREFHLGVTEDRLQRFFVTDPQFAPWRNPNGSINKEVLAQQGLSSAAFAQRLQQSLAQQQLTQGVSGTSLVPPAVATPALEAYFQQREVQVQRFEPKAYASKVEVTDAALEVFYQEPQTAARFLKPEQVDLEYVVFDLAAITKDLPISDKELEAFYEQNKTRYGNPEERRASHILVAVPPDAKADVRAQARAKAEALLETVKQNPRSFAEVARKNSQDAGSAKDGGDLNFLSREGIVKPFSDALFALQPGGLSPVVETEQGFHIIQMTDRRGGDFRSFASVRTELLDEARKAQAQSKFPDLATEFANLVSEQGDSLKGVADKWKLEVRTATNVTRNPTGTDPVLSNPKLLEAVFTPEAIRDKRNVPAIEAGPAQLVGARVLHHTPARQPALAEVQAAVRAAYVARTAASLARKEGEARLAALKAAPPATLGQPVETVSRAQRTNLPQPVLEQVLRAPAQALPAVVGRDLQEDGYVVALVTRVVGVDPTVSSNPEMGRSRYAQVWDEAESRAYFEALKKRFDVEIKTQK
ncbi:MAG: SurA N-terminal domain-containing protein [Pseudomonadota bacterium]